MSVAARVTAGLTLVACLVAALTGAAVRHRPHDVPLTLVGPPVVVVPLAERANAVPGRPFRATGVASGSSARASLRAGTTDAALVLDLARTRDRLILAPGLSPALARGIVAEVASVERGYRRSVMTETLPGAPTGRLLPLAWVACLLGWLLVAAISLLRGPFARSRSRGLARLAGLTGAGTLLGLFAGVLLPGGPGERAAAAAALVPVVLASGVGTLAAEAVVGLIGLVLAAAVVVLPPTLALQAGDPALLPAPARTMLAATPGGAGLTVLRAIAGGPWSALAVAVLAAWLILGGGVLVSARIVSERAGARGEAVAPGRPPHDPRWRSRVAAIVVPVVLALTVWAVAVPAGAGRPAASTRLASHTRCVYTGAVHGVAGLNRVTRIVRGSPAFAGGDVGETVTLGDGRRLWLFGDTLRAAAYAGQRFVRNSMLLVRPGCLEVVLPDDGGAIIPDRADGVGYWPMAAGALHRPGYDLVSVAAQRIRSTGKGVFDFADLGPSIAVFLVPRGGTPQLLAQRDIGPDDADPARPMWGAAAAIDHGWLYLYGTARARSATTGGFALSVARVRPLRVLDRSAWRFWDGRGWSARAAAASVLIPSAGGVSQTLSVFRLGRTWYAFSKRDEVLGHDLVFWTAPGPTGPFTARPPVAQLPSDGATGTLRYLPLAHPDLFPEPGTMVISYSRNSTRFQRVLRDPLLYRPRFLRVRLPRD